MDKTTSHVERCVLLQQNFGSICTSAFFVAGLLLPMTDLRSSKLLVGPRSQAIFCGGGKKGLV